ncbi:MAG: EpsI family protein [Gammaproteobacteria bacterium]|nr:EpsI family protein [Gammaproteobacteria bacterium]
MPLSTSTGIRFGNVTTVAFVFIVILWLAVTRATVGSLMDDWRDANSNYGHGFLVLGLCLFALWRSRKTFSGLKVDGSWFALPFVVADSLLWATGELVHVELVQYFALAAMFPLLVWACFGLDAVRWALFPLGFIWTAIPVWDPLMPLFQSITAHAATYMLQVIGIPVFREGNALSIPYGNFQIAEFCAGMRYLLAAVSLGAFFAWFYLARRKDRLTFMGLILVVAIVANWLRVTVVIIAGHLTMMQSPLVKDHAFMGWMLFAGVMLPVFWYGGRLARNLATTDKGRGWGRQNISGAGEKRLIPMLVLLLAGLVCGPGLVYRIQGDGQIARGTEQALPNLERPAVLGPWRADTAGTMSSWSPVFHGATREGMFGYIGTGERVLLYMAYYRRQSQGKELIYVRNRLYDKTRWQAVRDVERSAAETGGPAVRMTVLRANDGSDRLRFLWYWYDVGGMQLISKKKVKLMELWSLLKGQPGSTLVAVATDIQDSKYAEAVLSGFLRNAEPGIRASIAELEEK